ncbi:MAG: nitroreductase family protein [Nitrospirota bacterium]
MDVIDAIKSRRSIRRFIDKPVKKIDILKMIEAARMAPSGGNTQPWHFIVVRDRGKIKRMESLIERSIDKLPHLLKGYGTFSETEISAYIKRWKRDSLFFAQAPLTMAVMVKDIIGLYYREYLQYIMEKHEMNECEARKYMGYVEIMSVSAAIENLLLSAHSLGYGACWMRVPFIAKEDLKNLLNVQFPWDLIAFIPIGYPDPEYPLPKVRRKKIEDIATFI